MDNRIPKFLSHLNKPIDGSSIAIFRIGFGILMIWEILYLIRIDFVTVFLVRPEVQLQYEFATFLKILPKIVLNIIQYVLLAAAVCMTLGKYFRVAAITFLVGFTYFFLLDKAYYNNHLYLICLFSFFFCFVPADNRFSISRKAREKVTRWWHLWLFRIQLGVVYFFWGNCKNKFRLVV